MDNLLADQRYDLYDGIKKRLEIFAVEQLE